MTSAAPSDLDTPPSDSRFLRSFWRLVRWALPARFKFFGVYEYRIAKVYPGGSSSTVALDLQATEATLALGLDDIPKVETWPGVAGMVAAATGDARVLVSFIGGEASRPFVSWWAPSGDAGWLPAGLTIDTTGTLRLGPSASAVVSGSPTVATRNVREGDSYTATGAIPGTIVLTFLSTPQLSGPTVGKG